MFLHYRTTVYCCLLALANIALVAHGLRRLEPQDGKVLHMAGQSEQEFRGYAGYLGSTKLPLAYSSYHSLLQFNATGSGAAFFGKQRAFLQSLGDVDHAVLPHLGLALTPGGTVLPQINSGLLDLAIKELADGLPHLGRPIFLRIGYEFNGHWNNYSAPDFVAAWRRIEAVIARNTSTRRAVALVWDISCDAVDAHGDHTDFRPFFPGTDVVDWWGVNVFQKDPEGRYNSMPNSSCVLDLVSAARSEGKDAPVLIAESLPRFIAGVNGSNAWSSWFDPYLHTLLLGQPNVKAFSYINRDCGSNDDPDARPHCVGGQWGDARIQGTELKDTVGPRYSDALGAANFVHSCSLRCIQATLGL